MTYLDPNPKEFWSMQHANKYINNENRLRLKTLVLCLNRIYINPIDDILMNIAYYLTEHKSVLHLLDDLIRHPNLLNVPILSKITPEYSVTPGLSHLINNPKHNVGFELFDVHPNINLPKYCDILLGFVCDTSPIGEEYDGPGDIESTGLILIKRDSFYIRKMNFQTGIVIESIEFWTCDDFPFIIPRRFLSSVKCNNKKTMKALGCFINPDLHHDDIKIHYTNNGDKFKWGNLIYQNGRVRSVAN